MSSPSSAPVVALSPERARRDSDALGREIFDVLVIGGGIVGAGVALDAATRGLSVALVEAQDWASGTSSRSSKLIHGGLRYIQTHELSLVREALRERSILLQLAPHLVHPAQFLYPLAHRIERPYVGAGVALYDLLARLPGAPAALPRGRHLGAGAARALAPALRASRVAGGVVYYDAQVDDARLVLSVVRTAAGYGARVVSRARVLALTESGGATSEARVQLLESDRQVVVRAKTVVSATGVWTEDLMAMTGSDALRMRPSKGVHVLVARSSISARTALIIPTAKSVLFVLPWGAHWIIGTTDTPWSLDRDRPAATSADIDYLLKELNSVLARPIGREAIESVYVGLRPLLAGGAGATAQLSREHGVAVPRPGLALVAGGKYTTFRVMAKEALDAALKSAGLLAGPSCSEQVLIAGAEGYLSAQAKAGELARASGLSLEEVERLLGRYGSLINELLTPSQLQDPLGQIAAAPGYLRAEVAYAVTHEGARHLEDVLARRTRAAIECSDRGAAAAAEVAALMAPLLGWSATTAADELGYYRAAVQAEQRAEQLPDDLAAQAELASAPFLPLP